jgi:hypothetical protein
VSGKSNVDGMDLGAALGGPRTGYSYKVEVLLGGM